MNRVVVAGEPRGRHVPASGSGADQHRPRDRRDLPHRLEEVADAGRSVGVLVAVLLVAVALDDADLRRIGAELVGEQHRQRAADALPHLGAVADDRDDAVDADLEERVGREHHRGCRDGLAGGAGHQRPPAEREPGARGPQAGDEAAPRDLEAHGPAAFRTAARIRR
jgi:hypothetical protein